MSNPCNVCVLTGKIPTTDKIRYDYTDNAENISRCRMNGYVNVRRNYKKKDEQYYPNDLIKFVVFGPSAKYMNQYVSRGDTVQMTGSIEKEDDFEKDGQKFYGQLVLVVDSVSKQYDTPNDSNNNETSKKTGFNFTRPTGGSLSEGLRSKFNKTTNGSSNPFAKAKAL